MTDQLYGGIEGGGTKFVCAIMEANGQILTESRFDTTNPQTTLSTCAEFFESHAHLGTLSALGIASFGPVDPNLNSPTYGHILNTPKPGWSHTDVVAFFRRRLGLPIAFDSDVNGAALAEQIWGAGKGLANFVYYTIGTGIGAGVILDGRLVHGALTPEMGHMRVPHDRTIDPFEGSCPFHGDCLEGLANGPALEKRWKTSAENLPPDHPAWPLEADYLAAMLHNTICTFTPERVIMGGGVMSQTQLFPMIHQRLKRSLNNYIQLPAIEDRIEDYVVHTPLEGKAGVLGALALALSLNPKQNQRRHNERHFAE